MQKKIDLIFILFMIVFNLFFGIIPVWAAQEGAPIFTMEEIVVIASKYPEELLDSVASVEIISKQQINISQSENLAGILQNIGGLEILDYGSAGDIKSVSIRGSSPEQVLVMINGQVVNDPQTGKIDLGQIPADLIEKVEIYRGTASALYGANALGGVINIITHREEAESKGKAAVSFGSYQSQKYQASYQNYSDDRAYYLTGQYFKTDGELENSQMNKMSFMAGISYEIDELSDLGLTLRYHDYQRGLPGPTDYPTPEALQKDRDFNLNLKWQKREDDCDTNLMAWYHFHRTYYNNPGAWGHTGASIHKTHATGISFDRTHYDFDFGDEDNTNSGHTLTWGAEVNNNQIESTDIGNHKNLNGAIFVQDSWQPSEDGDLTIIAGLRYDYNQTFGGQLNPRVGMNYRIQDEVSFHISVGRAYRAPTFDDLYWPEDAYVGGNPDLVPENAWAYEAGFRFINKDADTQAELNIFRKNANQLINWAADSVGIWRPSNIGSARADGLEVLLKKELTEHLLANLNYTYLNAIDLDAQTQLKPKHKYGFGLSYYDQIGDHEDDFSIGMDGYIVSGRPDDLESYYLFDLNMARDITIDEEDDKKIQLNLSVKNVFNQKPEVVSGYPVQGRTFMVGISTDF